MRSMRRRLDTAREHALLLTLITLALLAALSTQSCAKAPPHLSPPAQQAFYKTRVVKVLDLVRDFAIDGEATTPKVVSTNDARHIVEYHQSAVKIMLAADAGWAEAVKASLDETVSRLSPDTRAKVSPYVTLVKVTLDEVIR